MSDLDIYDEVLDFATKNHLIDVEDKLPVFICSIGAHLFNAVNKCSMCDFDPDDYEDEPNAFTIPYCPLRHENRPIYTPMSKLPDTRIHILMRGIKGSGKSVLVDFFLAERSGLLWSSRALEGIGFNTAIGPNSITEAGMFGSVDEDGNITGRPLAREMCGGFLGFEEFSALTDSMGKDHSVDMKNQMLTSTDNGRVNKAMRSGWVRYNTRYTIWAGTQPSRFELESGLDRRFFIIEIDMDAEKESIFKAAQARQSNMNTDDRVHLAEQSSRIKDWFVQRQVQVMCDPPTGVYFSDDLSEWLARPEVRSFESDLFRRLALGYHMMQPKWEWGGKIMLVDLDDRLTDLLNSSLRMRRNVMDADLQLIRTTFWMKDMPKSTLVKEVARMVTMGDYQSARRWIEETLVGQPWYSEFTPQKEGRGRRGITCRFGPKTTPKEAAAKKQIKWGEQQ